MESFSPNCSLPSAGGQFVAAPNVRGSLEIVWSCVSVLILCCWSILHLHVPPQFHPETGAQKIRKSVFLFYLKVKWMGITFGGPETVMAKAITDFLSARKFSVDLQALAKEDGVEWSRSHTMFANVGGFVICFPPENRTGSRTGDENGGSSHIVDDKIRLDAGDDRQRRPIHSAHDVRDIHTPRGRTHREDDLEGRGHICHWKERTPQEQYLAFHKSYQDRVTSTGSCYGPLRWTLHPAHDLWVREIFASMTDSNLINVHNLTPLSGSVWVLNAVQLLEVRRRGIIKRLPSLTADELGDRNKSDSLVKIIALGQSAWLVFQLLVRYLQDKPSSPLEVMTVAFFICSLITYLMLWNQPKDASTPVYVTASRDADKSDIEELGKIGPTPFLECYEPPTAIPFNSYPAIQQGARESSTLCVILSSAVGSIIFGSIHLLAWNFDFPTIVDRWLWISASFVTALAPAVLILVFVLWYLKNQKLPAFMPLGIRLVNFPVLALFALARCVILVEALRTVYFLPPGAFSSTWAANTPHLG